MSLNELVSQDYKLWLNAAVNSIKIDEDWSYKESDKASGDNLVLDENLVAQWRTVPASSPYGNAIAVRPAQETVNNTSTPVKLNYLAPFSPLFSFTNNSDGITIVQPGTYIAFANLTFNNNLDNSFSIDFRKQSDSIPTLYELLPGSRIRTFPGNTLFSSNVSNVAQYTNISNSAVIITTVPNRIVKLYCSTGVSGNLIDSYFSSIVIVKVA